MNSFRTVANLIVSCFGSATRISSITPADADRFRALTLHGRAKPTANKMTARAKQLFGIAVKQKTLDANPFAHLKGLTVKGNPESRIFIPADDVRKVIDIIPCPQLRLFIALARFGGLRVPSESSNLRWGDIDWSNNRFIVRADKTEHHDDGGIRVVPIFAELRPYFEAAWDAAEEGSEFVITRYREEDNVRTRLARYTLAAGLVPWAKPFQNMRASRATELADVFPSHVCAKWLGHTERIADEFYRSVTDEHWRRAAGQIQSDGRSDGKSDGVVDGSTRKNGEQRSARGEKSCPLCEIVPSTSAHFRQSDKKSEALSGHERLHFSRQESGFFQEPDGRNGLLTATDREFLLSLVERWSSLSENVRAAIRTLAGQ
jgi:integrase